MLDKYPTINMGNAEVKPINHVKALSARPPKRDET